MIFGIDINDLRRLSGRKVKKMLESTYKIYSSELFREIVYM